MSTGVKYVIPNKKGDQSRFKKDGPLFSFHEPKA